MTCYKFRSQKLYIFVLKIAYFWKLFYNIRKRCCSIEKENTSNRYYDIGVFDVDFSSFYFDFRFRVSATVYKRTITRINRFCICTTRKYDISPKRVQVISWNRRPSCCTLRTVSYVDVKSVKRHDAIKYNANNRLHDEKYNVLAWHDAACYIAAFATHDVDMTVDCARAAGIVSQALGGTSVRPGQHVMTTLINNEKKKV